MRTILLRLALFAAALSLFTATSSRAAETYEIDPGHGAILFAVDHFSVSRMWCSFDTFTGTIEFDAEDPTQSSVNVMIQTASLHSANSERVAAVSSPFFLDVENHALISFTSKSIAAAEDGFVMTGDLMIRGVTKSVEMPFSFRGPISDPFGAPRIGIRGELEVDRRDFGITFDRATKEGNPLVGNLVTILVEVEAVPATK